jgi:hypothetical protein
MGLIIPWHSLFLSHGISQSTWSDAKQCGQWFLHVLEAMGIACPHEMQVKLSFIFFIPKNFVKKKTKKP